MNKNMFSIKNLVVYATVAGSVLATSSPVFANKENNTAKTAVAAQSNVALTSTDATGSTFQVTFNPGTKTKFELIVRNAENEVLYKQQFESENFSRLVKVQNEGDGDASFRFVIRNLENGDVYAYNVNSNVKWVKSIVVVKQ